MQEALVYKRALALICLDLLSLVAEQIFSLNRAPNACKDNRGGSGRRSVLDLLSLVTSSRLVESLAEGPDRMGAVLLHRQNPNQDRA